MGKAHRKVGGPYNAGLKKGREEVQSQYGAMEFDERLKFLIDIAVVPITNDDISEAALALANEMDDENIKYLIVNIARIYFYKKTKRVIEPAAYLTKQ